VGGFGTEKSLEPSGIEPLLLGRSARSRIAMLTELFRLAYFWGGRFDFSIMLEILEYKL
jgi:hypothetical protein